MTAYSGINMNVLRRERAKRRQDEQFRFTMGLYYVGLHYVGGWHKDPIQLFKDDRGRSFARKGHCKYEQIFA